MHPDFNPDETRFSRRKPDAITRELRGDAPSELVEALDALALAKNQSRTQYVNDVLMAHVKSELHERSVVTRALAGNPLMPDTTPHNTSAMFKLFEQFMAAQQPPSRTNS